MNRVSLKGKVPIHCWVSYTGGFDRARFCGKGGFARLRASPPRWVAVVHRDPHDGPRR